MTRRQLLWGGGLLVPAALGGAWGLRRLRAARPGSASSMHSWDSRRIVHAMQHHIAGYPDKARGLLEKLLAAEPSHAPARFLLACIALEQGQRREMNAALSQLESLVPHSQEARLLVALEEQRRRAPQGSWFQAFRAAWTELGRPDFHDSRVLPEPLQGFLMLSEQELEERLHGVESPDSRFILTLMAPARFGSRERGLLEQVPRLETPELLFAFFERLCFADSSLAQRQAAAPMLLERLTQLVGPEPRIMQLALLPLLAGASPQTPLSRQELEALEAVTACATWRDVSLERTFLSYRSLFRELKIPAAGSMAWHVVAWFMGVLTLTLLMRRVEATRPRMKAEDERWVGRMLWHIGARLGEQRSWSESWGSAELMRLGARDMRDTAAMAVAMARKRELEELERPWENAALERWPLAALMEEQWEARARDELACMRNLLE